jgi:hypothetical protein
VFVARCAVLGRRCSLRRHLQLANLALRQSPIVIARGLLLLLRLFGLLGRLWWLGLLVHVWLFVRAIEIYTGGRRWYLALGFEESGLQVDDVIAQLVVLCLERLVKLA